MTDTLTIVNPVATPRSHADGERFPPAPRPASLDGATVALYWNGKQNGLDALARARELIDARFTGVTFVELTGALGGTTRYLDDEQLALIEKKVDVLVGTTADCGSCCSWLMRDLCEVERRGVPAVGYTAAIFDEDARFSAKTFGVPEACPVIVPECFSNKGTDEIRAMVDDSFDEVVALLTTERAVFDVLPEFASMVLESAPELVFDGADLMDAFDGMQRRFVANGWSDGLPLVPPTRRKVDAMIAASGFDGDHVVGDFAPGFGIGTVEKIAANAVMAGCRPETMPVLMAVMECVLDPSIGLRTWAMSTGPQAPLILVSGPIADEIGMNRGICALGPGSISEVNVAIGRALRLVMMNVGLSYPGITDMDTIGTPMKFSACVAENEERTPWDPWRVQQGFGRDESTVTVNVPYGMTEFFDFQNSDPELLIESWSTLTSQAVGTPAAGAWLIKQNAPLSAGYPFHGTFSNMLLMAPDHAAAFAAAGWGPAEIREAIHRRTKLPFRQVMLNQSMPAFEVSHPELRWLLDAPDTMITVNPSADCFEFFVVGAKAGRSQFCFGGTNSVTKAVGAAVIEVSAPRPYVGLVTLHRPGRRNALDLPGFRGLAQAWRDLAAGGIRAAVVTGRDDFSSGADLKTFPDDMAAALRGGEPHEHLWGDVNGALLRDAVPPFAVVAAVEGICLGAGMELVGATDIRVAGQSATFGLPEVTHGFMASGGSVARLPRQIGYAAAMQVLLTGDRFTADRMLAWGFVSEVVPDGTALDRALDLAERIAGHPPAGVRGIKRAVGEGLRGTLADAYGAESRIGAELTADR